MIFRKHLIKQFIPQQIEPTIREIYCVITDPKDYFFYLSKRDDVTPPRRLTRRIGSKSENFKEVGDNYLQYLVEELKDLKLKPNEKILEVGCGCGRVAVALTKYLAEEGSYEGLDIDTDAINWCRKHITQKFPHFNFQFADIYNTAYNPKGKYKASKYKFPYAEESFNFILLISVFTHMLPTEVENYLSEIKRLLKTNGRCLISYYLLNSDSLKLNQDFKYDFGEYRSTSLENPEKIIALNEDIVLQLYEKSGLKVLEPIRYGTWCGRPGPDVAGVLYHQDLILAEKR